MTQHKIIRTTLVGVLCFGLAACGGRSDNGAPRGTAPQEFNNDVDSASSNRSSIWDLFGGTPDQKVQVNRYLWNASLDVLEFLPVQSVDPFTGVIVTGYGNPPGSGRSYRATVHIKDPALDARSLNVSLQTKGGRPVSASTTRAVEDAILSRARQLRIADKNL
ncbi:MULTISPECIES: DUF3576 domain-containing protein [unclassified Pseudophaeobacter]|uniref:DUF3576 domain-containing protein n=1 Tax=unclassified Pseudophaeobacter TaxID=2637024 RepID=UPI000EFD571F|nr:DUF3576 domain-containing protein [Pseudophaeobacter sp. EL27]